MSRITILMSIMFLVGCSDSMSAEPVETYDFQIETRLELDSNGYYHFNMDNYTNGGSQALIRFTAHTNNPEIQFVWWDCNTTWDYDFMGTLHSVDIINHSSYTDALGQANTMFGPQVFMVSDTVIVYVGYTDSIYDVEYMKTFSVILEGDTTYE